MSTYNEVTFFNKLSLRFLIHRKQGGDNINLANLENDFGGTSAEFDKATNKLGVPDGIYLIMQVGVSAREFVQNSSYLKVREAGIYYKFDNLCPNFIQSIQAGFSLNNYFYHHQIQKLLPQAIKFRHRLFHKC